MLIGRDREAAVLDALLDEARQGRSSVLALVGEAGIGKSILLDHAAAAAAATGMRTLRARGIESEARIPFAALFELLRPALPILDRLSVPQREALEGALALRPARAQDRFAIGAATLGLLTAYAEDAPVLVLVDDAQWLDGSSASALLFAMRRLVADALAVVLTAREGEASLLDGSDLPTMRLEGLDLDAAATLVARHAVADLSREQIARLHHGTGGNPLALVELAGVEASSITPVTPAEPLPVGARIIHAYAQRYARLDEPEQMVLLLAAAGDVADLATLVKAATHAGLDAHQLAGAEAAGLVTIDLDRVSFRHPLVRSAIYAGARAELRREAHRSLAAVLPDADADRRAWHLARSTLGPDGVASSAMEQAGRRAHARSAYEVATHAFERAAALAPTNGRRCVLLHAAADSAWIAGLAHRAVDLLESARRDVDDIAVWLSIEQLRGHIATRLGPVLEGLRILREGAERAAGVDVDRAVIILAEAANAAFYAGDPAAMSSIAARIAELAGATTTTRARFFAALAQGMALIFTGSDQARGASLVRDAVALVKTSDEIYDDPRFLAWGAMGPLWLRESQAGGTLVERAIDAVRARSAVGVLPFLLSHIAVDRAASERWTEAEVAFHEAISFARETGQRTDLAFALARLSTIEARQGRGDDCRAHAAEARDLASELGLTLIEIWALGALGDLALGAGDLEVARDRYRARQQLIDTRSIGDADLSAAPELVEIALRLGRDEDAVLLLDPLVAAAETKGQPWALARAARCRGLVVQDSEFDRHFEQALALHQETPDAFETARTRLAYGSRLRRSRRRVHAREQLRVALDIFDRLGAEPWFEAARAELAATGETARQRNPSTRDQLTPQELQVALALASGRTTREAAAALFVSPKTIEYHLRSIYRKLAINSRDQLATAMEEASRS